MQTQHFHSLVHTLVHRAQVQPGRAAYTFLVDGTTAIDSLTYGELDRNSREIALMLQRVLKPGDRALLMYPPGLDFISAFFGCLYAGVIAVPAYPPQPSRPEHSLPRMKAILTESGSRAVLCKEDFIEKYSSLFHASPELADCSLLATDHDGLECIEQWSMPDNTPESLAFLQYTSGSTAAPKGVAVSHANILHNLAYIQHVSFHETQNVLVSWLPTYHDMGLFAGVLFPLFNNCPAYLMSPVSFLQKPVRWLEAISHFHGTNSGGPNFAYDLCVQRISPEQIRELDLSSWKIAYNGAEPIRRSTLESFSTKFRECGFRRSSLFPVYGLAESTVFVSGKPLSDTQADPITVASPSELVNCGSPKFGMDIVIVDPERRTEMQADEIGEIWVRGPSVAAGYWNQPSDTERTFRAFLESGDGPFLRTGDLGFMRTGELHVTGRIKDLIIVRGRKHYPQDIEQTVELCHAEVQSQGTAALSVDFEVGTQLVILVEVSRRLKFRGPAEDDEVDGVFVGHVEEIVACIRESVSERHELQVEAIHLLNRGSIPKTSSGKIRRHACCDAIKLGNLDCLASWDLRSGLTQSRKLMRAALP
jgi:acyl-CoA synthetase (AMP-forming)/AMP-acid ligase II